WNSLSNAITRTASDCLGRTIPGAILTDRQAWFWTNAVQEAVKAKRKALSAWRKTRSQTEREIYLATKRLARVTVSRAKRNYYKDIYDSLDTADGKNEVYRLARSRQAATADI